MKNCKYFQIILYTIVLLETISGCITSIPNIHAKYFAIGSLDSIEINSNLEISNIRKSSENDTDLIVDGKLLMIKNARWCNKRSSKGGGFWLKRDNNNNAYIDVQLVMSGWNSKNNKPIKAKDIILTYKLQKLKKKDEKSIVFLSTFKNKKNINQYLKYFQLMFFQVKQVITGIKVEKITNGELSHKIVINAKLNNLLYTQTNNSRELKIFIENFQLLSNEFFQPSLVFVDKEDNFLAALKPKENISFFINENYCPKNIYLSSRKGKIFLQKENKDNTFSINLDNKYKKGTIKIFHKKNEKVFIQVYYKNINNENITLFSDEKLFNADSIDYNYNFIDWSTEKNQVFIDLSCLHCLSQIFNETDLPQKINMIYKPIRVIWFKLKNTDYDKKVKLIVYAKRKDAIQIIDNHIFSKDIYEHSVPYETKNGESLYYQIGDNSGHPISIAEGDSQDKPILLETQNNEKLNKHNEFELIKGKLLFDKKNVKVKIFGLKTNNKSQQTINFFSGMTNTESELHYSFYGYTDIESYKFVATKKGFMNNTGNITTNDKILLKEKKADKKIGHKIKILNKCEDNNGVGIMKIQLNNNDKEKFIYSCTKNIPINTKFIKGYFDSISVKEGSSYYYQQDGNKFSPFPIKISPLNSNDEIKISLIRRKKIKLTFNLLNNKYNTIDINNIKFDPKPQKNNEYYIQCNKDTQIKYMLPETTCYSEILGTINIKKSQSNDCVYEIKLKPKERNKILLIETCGEKGIKIINKVNEMIENIISIINVYANLNGQITKINEKSDFNPPSHPELEFKNSFNDLIGKIKLTKNAPFHIIYLIPLETIVDMYIANKFSSMKKFDELEKHNKISVLLVQTDLDIQSEDGSSEYNKNSQKALSKFADLILIKKNDLNKIHYNKMKDFKEFKNYLKNL